MRDIMNRLDEIDDSQGESAIDALFPFQFDVGSNRVKGIQVEEIEEFLQHHFKLKRDANMSWSSGSFVTIYNSVDRNTESTKGLWHIYARMGTPTFRICAKTREDLAEMVQVAKQKGLLRDTAGASISKIKDISAKKSGVAKKHLADILGLKLSELKDRHKVEAGLKINKDTIKNGVWRLDVLKAIDELYPMHSVYFRHLLDEPRI